MMVWVMRLAYTLMRVQWWIFRPILLGVRIVLLQGDQVLLVRHTYVRGWNFPGGSLHRGETPLEAAVREAREEVGAELLEPAELVGLFSSFTSGKSDHVALFVARNFRLGEATDRFEIAEQRFFALDELPAELGRGALRLLHDLERPGPRSERW
jgi:8-oxo-dGTP pyrophosphatase MutT (NUDIX family)